VTIPTGHAVESLAIAMAAGVGVAWPTASVETRAKVRDLAHLALMHMHLRLVDSPAVGAARLAETLLEGAETARAAARALDHDKGPEQLIQRLHKAAANIEGVGRMLGVLEPEEAVI